MSTLKYVITILALVVIGASILGGMKILSPEQVTASYGMVLSGFFGYLTKGPTTS